MPTPGFRTSSRSDLNSTGSPRRRANRGSADKTCGSFVEPGTPLSKAQQEARRDSVMDPLALDGQFDPKPQTTRENFAELATKMRLDSPQLDVFAPEAIPYTSEDFSRGRPPGNLRALIIFVIFFLIVFGSIYSLVEYLLLGIRASATCTPSTVYIPVTRYALPSGEDPAIDSNTTHLTIYSTATEVSTMTSYITIQPSIMATGLTSPSYYFTVNSAGSTDWLNGVSPPATASLTVITRSIYVTPVMPADSLSTTTATVTSTATIQQTITMPAYTSTVYSFMEPDTTVISTSTHYVTYTVSRASSMTDSADTTSPRPSYTGPGTYGWNSSSSNAPTPTGVAAAAQGDPQLTTMTEIRYWGTGDMTTSTMTSFITTSMRVAYTTIVTLSPPAPSDDPDFVTTVTALPVTITYSGGQGFSTSIAFNSSAISQFTSAPTAGGYSPYQTGASPSSPLLSSGASSAMPATQSSSSRIFTNSTSPVTISAAGYSPGISQSSSLPSSALSSNGSTAGAVTGSSSSTSLLSSDSVTTAPGPILTSTSASQTVSTSSSSARNSSSSTSAGSLSSSSSLGASSSTSSPSGVASAPYNTTTTASMSSKSTASVSAATTSISSTSTPIVPPMPPPAYGSFTPQTSSSTAATVGPASGSSASKSSSLPAASIASTSSTSTSSMLSSMQTLSTSIRTTSSSASSSPSGSPASSSNATSATGPSTSSSSQSASASANSVSSPASYSQTVTPATVVSITGIPASAASSMPTTGCGEYGDFMLDFDNLPSYMPTNRNQTDITQAPPIENPYHHFAFSDGYVYAPDPKVPYEPISQPHLAVFLGNGTGMRASQTGNTGNTIKDGEFADGPYESSSAFWFDAFSAWMGCDNEGPQVCTLVMNGYTYSAKEKDEVLSFTQNATVPGCPGYKNCKLQKVEFPDTFKGLSGLQIQAFVRQEERMFFLDDVAMKWSDNSCAAGLTRQRAR